MSFRVVLSDITQVSDRVKIKFISQLINDIFKLLQKLLKYFNETTNLTFYAASIFSLMLDLYLKDSEFDCGLVGSSL